MLCQPPCLDAINSLYAAPSPATNATADTSFEARVTAAAAADDPWAVASRAHASVGLWPVSFSLSRALLVARPPQSLSDSLAPASLAVLSAAKPREWSSAVPGNGYAFASESAFYAEYAGSWKAHTRRKAGVDCNRHVEILGNGAIPIFKNVTHVSRTTLFAYPRALLALAEECAAETNAARLATLRHFLLHWTHDHLSSPAMAAYMGRAADAVAEAHGAQPLALGEHASNARVVFINDVLPDSPDYLAMQVLVGLVEWLGFARVDILYPPRYMFEGEPALTGKNGTLYGYGFGYAGRLPRAALLAHRGTAAILEDLRSGAYAAAIWGSATRSLAHLDDAAVVAAYRGKPERLWLCDGEDDYRNWWTHKAWGPWSSLSLETTVFVRELGTVFASGLPVVLES